MSEVEGDFRRERLEMAPHGRAGRPAGGRRRERLAAVGIDKLSTDPKRDLAQMERIVVTAGDEPVAARRQVSGNDRELGRDRWLELVAGEEAANVKRELADRVILLRPGGRGQREAEGRKHRT